ncbi:hypothetical protein CQA57_02175 [Helicobacter anseris]|uniref:Autotransporter domain-containing protein n=1 Tax=Helicobacter anseris TaxID=375926 RepID=A0A3D8JAJ1_9HELI|nr:hypothetical protein CQA57_02175 [Helicobacter anseris]
MLVILSLSFFLQAATNKDVVQIKESYNSDTTENIFINLDWTPNNGNNGFSGCKQPDQSDCYSGAIFATYDTLTLNNNATLTVNVTATGNYGGWAAVFFRGQGGKTYTINGGKFVLNLLSLPDPNSTLPVEGVFMTRGAHSDLPVKFIFNTDMVVTATENFYITRGIFNVNDGKGGYQFNGNTYIDVSKMQKSKGWSGSGVGYRSITSLGGDGYFYMNYNPDTKTTYNRDNIIQLKGDIAVEKTSTATSEAIIHLTNPQSFFQGRFSLQGDANAELLLDRGGKWILTANSAVRTLNTNNNKSDLDDQYHNIDNIAVVDFIKIADDGSGSRLTSNATFQKRTLEIHRSLNGTNGVFRLMADVPMGQVDSVQTAELNGTQYIQIYQNGSRLSFDVAGKNMVVAHADTVNGDFVGLSTITGIYNYDPILTKVNQNGGTDWVLDAITLTPNQTAKTLFNILSTPYRIFRLHADSINHRIEDLLFPPTKFGAWAKMYGGGIYGINSFDHKESTQNLFFSFQGGFDYGKNFEDSRYFYGGSFDFLKLYGNDAGYDGSVSSYGFGAYAGFIKNDDLFLDAKIKYIFASFQNNLYQAQDPINFYGNILLLNLRAGYNFYFFKTPRTKTIQTCKRGNDGKLFCRNDKSVGYVRDTSFYIQPYLSITPGIISGHSLNFLDKISSYNVLGKLDVSPALITTVGILGVKRYEYDNFNVLAKTFIAYNYDINLGGKIMLVDDANIPLYNEYKNGDHRLSLGLGGEVLFFNDSLRVFADFKTEFFGALNTYWVFSGGLRYKFGNPPIRKKSSLSYRPKSAPKQRSFKEKFGPYKNTPAAEEKSFNKQNHFIETQSGYIRKK